jgi:ATP-dependent DNA helicase RecG
MNALMHRNYGTSYAPTRIVWFDDRIEVTNPGGPFGQARDDNFDRSPITAILPWPPR